MDLQSFLKQSKDEEINDCATYKCKFAQNKCSNQQELLETLLSCDFRTEKEFKMMKCLYEQQKTDNIEPTYEKFRIGGQKEALQFVLDFTVPKNTKKLNKVTKCIFQEEGIQLKKNTMLELQYSKKKLETLKNENFMSKSIDKCINDKFGKIYQTPQDILSIKSAYKCFVLQQKIDEVLGHVNYRIEMQRHHNKLSKQQFQK